MNVSLKPAIAAMLALATMTAGCSDDPVEPDTPQPTPPIEGSTLLITGSSFTAEGISGFLMTFDATSLTVVGIQYTFNGTLYTYDAAEITGAAVDLVVTWTVNAEWGNNSVFEFGGPQTGNALVGGSVWTITEATTAAGTSTTTMTMQ
jgi:hypothetical protein